MSSDKPRPTVDELFQLIKRSNIPTVLVEGRNDIIFYRSIEEHLSDIGIDMLAAGNKGAVLDLRSRLKNEKISIPLAFIVDNDLWVHTGIEDAENMSDVITTSGYSIENDLFIDGELENFLTAAEKKIFLSEIQRFNRWYALAVHRTIKGNMPGYRTHPGKVLEDEDFYNANITTAEGEDYPDSLHAEICDAYHSLLRGKSLFAILLRQLSKTTRNTKLGEKQLMAIGAARKGENFQRIQELVRARIVAQT